MTMFDSQSVCYERQRDAAPGAPRGLDVSCATYIRHWGKDRRHKSLSLYPEVCRTGTRGLQSSGHTKHTYVTALTFFVEISSFSAHDWQQRCAKMTPVVRSYKHMVMHTTLRPCWA